MHISNHHYQAPLPSILQRVTNGGLAGFAGILAVEIAASRSLSQLGAQMRVAGRYGAPIGALLGFFVGGLQNKIRWPR